MLGLTHGRERVLASQLDRKVEDTIQYHDKVMSRVLERKLAGWFEAI